MTLSRREELALRRQALQARVALQRVELQQHVNAVVEAASPTRIARRWAAGWRERPARVVLAIALLFALRRIGLRRVARHALTAWQMWQTIRFSGAATWP